MKPIILKGLIVFFLISVIPNCKKPIFKSFSDILREHQWRKTEEAVYNINNEFENYIFVFDDAEDCEKNSTIEYSSLFLYIHNICNDHSYSYEWKLSRNKDSVIYTPYYDSLAVSYSRLIVLYTKKEHILQYNTKIYGTEKIIKETYTAYEK